MPGDVVEVTVAGHPEFGGRWTVDRDGWLDIPEGGAFGVGGFSGRKFSRDQVGQVSGLQPAAIERKIADGLRRYVKQAPQVTAEIVGRGRG
jgi:protein involved in polysaccharide export with SLBB domain